MIKSISFVLSAVLLLLISSCERPFVEENPPDIVIVNPNIDELQSARSILVSAAVSSPFRDIESVTLNDEEMVYIAGNQTWRGNLDLVDGDNTFTIVAKDNSGLEKQLEATFLHYTPQFITGNDLPIARGGHSVSHNPISTRRNAYLLIGGAQSTSRDALGDVLRIEVVEDRLSYENSEFGLNHPRAGHTATRMNDMNTLIIGGSRRAEARTIDDLVETVERYNFNTGQIEIVPLDGDPIRRARHSTTRVTSSSGREYIYLLGGQGDIRYGTDPRLGIRDDLRLFEYRNDSLVAIPPGPIGRSFVEAVAGHTMIPITQGNGSGIGKYLVSSTEYDSSENFSAVHNEVEIDFDITTLNRVEIENSFNVPRTEYGASLFVDGMIGFFGGRGFAQNTALKSAEIYSARTLQYYLLPEFPQMRKERWDLTATKLTDSRILLTGGFDNSGNALRDVDFFSIQ